jgi:hypothetical protein
MKTQRRGTKMSLVVLIGAQAVGKMTVGRELEKRINGKLLFNHQTIDLFVPFLGYSPETFTLSALIRKELFKAFVAKENKPTETIIFTVLVGFDQIEDIAFLRSISEIFLQAEQAVYFVELVAQLEERLQRNSHEERLKAKPSKRDLSFSKQDLLSSYENYRLESRENELAELFPTVNTLKIDNTNLSAATVAEQIISSFNLS